MLGALGSIGGAALGGAIGGPMGAQIGGSLGGALLGGVGSYRTSGAEMEAFLAKQRAAEEAAKALKEAGKFTPVGYKSAFGGIDYQIGDGGSLQGVEFQLDPRFQERADLYAQLGGDVFGMVDFAGIETDPTKAATARYGRYQDIMAGERAAGTERLYGTLAAKGLTGIGADVGGGAYVNPLAAARESELAQMDERLLAQSYDLAQSDIAAEFQRQRDLLGVSQGLFGQEYDIYNRGQEALQYGMGLSQAQQNLNMDLAKQIADLNMQAVSYGGQANVQDKARQEALFSGIDTALRDPLAQYLSGGGGGTSYLLNSPYGPGVGAGGGNAAGGYVYGGW